MTVGERPAIFGPGAPKEAGWDPPDGSKWCPCRVPLQRSHLRKGIETSQARAMVS